MTAVSVIIPIYQVEEYIEECLLSAMRQTLQEIEIICVDDGTPDDSMKIVAKYAKTDNRIRTIHKENGGLSSARNAGLDLACGEYVYFLDSDDYLLPETLERLYQRAKADDLDSLCFDAKSFYENEEIAKTFRGYDSYYLRTHSYEGVFTGQELFAKMMTGEDWCASAWLQFTKRSLLETAGIRFLESIIHEDNLFTAQVSLAAKRAGYVPEAFYQRRVRAGSIMTSRSAIRSAVSYYRCILEIQPLILAEDTDPGFLPAYLRLIDKWQRGAARALKTLTDEEFDAFLYGETPKEQMHFELTVKGFARRLREQAQTDAKLREKTLALRASHTMRAGSAIRRLFP